MKHSNTLDWFAALQSLIFHNKKLLFFLGGVWWVIDMKRDDFSHTQAGSGSASLPGVLYDRLFNCASERVKEMETRSQLGQNFSQVWRVDGCNLGSLKNGNPTG